MLTLVRGLGVTTVVVLHDLNLAARYCDRIVLLHEGRIRAAGTPEQVLTPEFPHGFTVTPPEDATGSYMIALLLPNSPVALFQATSAALLVSSGG